MGLGKGKEFVLVSVDSKGTYYVLAVRRPSACLNAAEHVIYLTTPSQTLRLYSVE
jgi:hypothetical protein